MARLSRVVTVLFLVGLVPVFFLVLFPVLIVLFVLAIVGLDRCIDEYLDDLQHLVEESLDDVVSLV